MEKELAGKDAEVQTFKQEQSAKEEVLVNRIEALEIEADVNCKQLMEVEGKLQAKEENLEALRSQAKTREKRIGELETDCQAKGLTLPHKRLWMCDLDIWHQIES